MRKHLTYLTSCIILLAYSIGIWVSIGAINSSQKTTSGLTNEAQHRYENNAVSVLSHTLPSSEYLSFSDNTLSTSLNLEDTPSSMLGTLWHKEQQLNAVYKQYTLHDVTTLLSHRKKDIIYPFHDFW
ncbi:hypothetical protein [Mangrovimonas spongiae]|uniref:Uncharacterized protein n=1 Tax=Mangrovimonas spongiae TaxID=2494697 RepID=A0A428K2U5_9FLAO|nr:hypothetical protein [Mangrovimonas spongiae]RSK40742.1 hypothetical protein EJA19_07115 [Mangrovimonas spongiae]